MQKHGSLAIIERWFRTLKEIIRQWPAVPYGEREFRKELKLVVDWYNDARPHQSLRGCTPNEMYSGRRPATERRRWETRKRWPHGKVKG